MRKSRAAWAVAGILAVAGAGGWWRALSAPRPAPPGRTAFAVSIPGGDTLAYDDTPVLAVSRDGSQLVYAAERGGARELFLRSFDAVDVRMLEGTGGARSPFFSPDGRWIGFFAEGKLMKVPSGGGPPQTVCEGVTQHRGAAWADDDTIVLSDDFATGLSRVSARGGKLELLTKVDTPRGERSHRWPDALPGGEAVLYTIGSVTSPGNYDDAKIALFDRKTGKSRVLIEGGSMARYCPSGHLLYVRAKSLLAVPFDLSRREVTGEPFPLQEKIAGDPSSGIGYFSIAADGSIAFVPGTTVVGDSRLVLTDRKGSARELPLPQRPYRFPRFSPDGKTIALSIGSGRGADDDVWLYDVASGVLTRLTFSTNSFSPIWSRDGRRVAYVSARAKDEGIHARAADGSGAEEWLYNDYTARLPSDWSLDGRTLIFTHPSNEVWLATLKSVGTASAPPVGEARVLQPHSSAGAYSPDDRFVAYGGPGSAGSVSEIFVTPADGSGEKWQLTTDGGHLPIWIGNEIYSLHGNQIRVTQVETKPAFKAGLPQTLFEGKFELRTTPLRNYDVTRDGKQFVFVRGGAEVGAREIDVVLNWARNFARGSGASAKP